MKGYNPSLMKDVDTLVNNIRGILAKKRMTQEELALRSGMVKQTLSAKLNYLSDFSFCELIKISKALNVPLTKLFNGIGGIEDDIFI